MFWKVLFAMYRRSHREGLGKNDLHAGIFFAGECCHPETNILTRSGWIEIQDISAGENLCTLAPNGDVKIQSVIKIHQFKRIVDDE